MFNLRYFARRYFPDRYFPEIGLTPPVPNLGQLRLLLNGFDRTDHLSEVAPSTWNLMRGSRGTCSLNLILPGDDTTCPQVGQLIEIFDPPETRVWCGTVESIEIKWIGDDGWRMITVQGVTLEALYDTANLDKVHYAKKAGVPFTAGAIVADLFTRADVPLVTLGTISAGVDILTLEVTNVGQGFSTLALDCGFVWYIDPKDLKLYFHDPTARGAAFTVYANDILWDTIDWKQSRADFRDTQVLQLPGLAQLPSSSSFAGDNTQTVFTLPVVPEYLISVDVLPMGATGKSISWNPGSSKITITPAPDDVSTVQVKYATSGVIVVNNGAAAAIGIGARSALYTRTHAFTEDGGTQEATAIVARYSMLPSTLQFSTDKPGIAIARALTIDVDHPLHAADTLNGVWLVQEVEGSIVPGLDQLEEPYGHFRYTLHLVNSAATAVFQGDGSTSVFTLPETPSAVSNIRVNDTPFTYSKSWLAATNYVTITPAPRAGESVAVDYRGANSPDVPTFVQTWEGLGDGQGAQPSSPVGSGEPVPATGDGPPSIFTRTLLLKDLAVGDDIADHVPVYHDGTAVRLLGVLRKTITADLTVRINKKTVGLSPEELITVTIPAGAVVDDVYEWSLAAGSPAVLPPFFDKDIFSADILESDGSTDVDGIASFTIEWELI